MTHLIATLFFAVLLGAFYYQGFLDGKRPEPVSTMSMAGRVVYGFTLLFLMVAALDTVVYYTGYQACELDHVHEEDP